MFTGIIEAQGQITHILEKDGNRVFQVSSPLSGSLKTDQSLSHNGVCLTVEQVDGNSHQVTAIAETLQKTNLGQWQTGTQVNLERCLTLNSRLDGHIVQGHVDGTGTCVGITEKGGSWEFRIKTDPAHAALMINKGSIALNGISLTLFDLGKDDFTVAIIPYTYTHTNMNRLRVHDTVNLEFDMIGKYVARLASLHTLR